MRSLQEAMKILKNKEKLKIIEESQNSGLKLLRDLVRQSRKNKSKTLEGVRVVVVTTSARNPYENFVVSKDSRSYYESRYKLGLSTGKLHLDDIKNDEGPTWIYNSAVRKFLITDEDYKELYNKYKKALGDAEEAMDYPGQSFGKTAKQNCIKYTKELISDLNKADIKVGNKHYDEYWTQGFINNLIKSDINLRQESLINESFTDIPKWVFNHFETQNYNSNRYDSDLRWSESDIKELYRELNKYIDLNNAELIQDNVDPKEAKSLLSKYKDRNPILIVSDDRDLYVVYKDGKSFNFKRIKTRKEVNLGKNYNKVSSIQGLLNYARNIALFVNKSDEISQKQQGRRDSRKGMIRRKGLDPELKDQYGVGYAYKSDGSTQYKLYDYDKSGYKNYKLK